MLHPTLAAVKRTIIFGLLSASFVLSTPATADTVVIGGEVNETQFLPKVGVLIIESSGSVVPPEGDVGVEADTGASIRMEGGLISTMNARGIDTSSHADITLMPGSEIASDTSNSISTDEHARIDIAGSTLSGTINADEFAWIRLESSTQDGGSIRADGSSRVELVDSEFGGMRLGDRFEAILKGTYSDGRLLFDSNGSLYLDADSSATDWVRGNHGLQLEIHGTITTDPATENRHAVSVDTGARIELVGANLTVSGTGQNGVDAGAGSILHVTGGTEIQATGDFARGIQLDHSGTLVIDGGSHVESPTDGAFQTNSAIEVGRGGTISINDATIHGEVDIGRGGRVSLDNSQINSDRRGLRIRAGGHVTVSGAATELVANGNDAINADDGSEVIILDGLLRTTGESNDPGIDLGDGGRVGVHGGHIETEGRTSPAVEMRMGGDVVMDDGTLETAGNDSSGIRLNMRGRARLSGDAIIVTSGDATSDPISWRGAHGITGRDSLIEITGGQIDVHGGGSFGVHGFENSLIVVSNGLINANTSLGSYDLGAFDDSTIRIEGLASTFTVEIDGGDGEEPVQVDEGESVSLGDLYEDFDGEDPFSGTIRGEYSDGESFELTFFNQFFDQEPGTILLAAVEADPEPDPSTETSLSSQLNPSEVDEAVLFVAEVTNPDTAPDDGQVTVTATSGESCTDDSEPVTSGNTATFSCEIVFESVGTRGVTATYSDSEILGDSTSETITQMVELGLFIDRFESQIEPESDDDETSDADGSGEIDG